MQSTTPTWSPITVAPGNNWTNTSGFNCVGVHTLPLEGAEILILALFYLGLLSMTAVTFVDIALKQTWPSKFLDTEVQKRVAQLQAAFPKLKQNTKLELIKSTDVEEEDEDAKEWDPILKPAKSSSVDGTVTEADLDYNKVVSQEPYVASCCIDEDLTFVLANNWAYGTVSAYCSSTVRGYAMLSSALLITGIIQGFLWVHNAMIYPVGDNYSRYGPLIGYFLVFLTGIVMTNPENHTIQRNRNIAMWGSIPTSSWLLKLHDVGIVGYALVPTLGNLWQLLTIKDLPNATAMWIGIGIILFGLVIFEGGPLLHKAKKITQIQANKIQIIGEIILVMTAMISFTQIETYSSAACSEMVQTYDKAICGVILGILAALCIKHYTQAPVAPYANGPSVLLMKDDQMVATSGPIPVLNYNREFAVLPIVQPATSDKQ